MESVNFQEFSDIGDLTEQLKFKETYIHPLGSL